MPVQNLLPVLILSVGTTPVVQGGDTPGWVSGDLSTIPASTTRTILFYLGPNWMHYSSVAFSVLMGPTANLSGVRIGSRDSVGGADHLFAQEGSGGTSPIWMAVNANAATCWQQRIAGPYLALTLPNADAVNSASVSSLRLACYPIS